MYYILKRKLHKVQNSFQPKAFILMYHRVTELEIDPWDLAVSKENFEEQLVALKKTHHIISMDELVHAKKNKKLKGRTIAITFDDGYRDNYTNAFPILVKHQVPATFFISSAYIENQKEFWWDRLIRLILNDRDLPKKLELEAIDKCWDMQHDKDDKKVRFDFFMEVWSSLVQVHPVLRSELLSQIEAWSNSDKIFSSDHLPMNRTELIALSQHPLITIGAHTNNHAALAYLNQESQREEIQIGKLWLEKVLERPITGFSYPNGSYNSETISLMKENGFDYACTTEEFRNSNYSSDYKLPRFQVCNWNKETFLNRLEQW